MKSHFGMSTLRFCHYVRNNIMDIIIIGPQREKTCLPGFANNKGADQPAHLRSLINAFVIHLLKIVISKIATGEASFF